MLAKPALSLVPMLLALVACSGRVDIKPEASSDSTGSSHGHHGSQGAGTGGASATSTGAGASSSTGTGAGAGSCCDGVQRTVTAELDPAQHVFAQADAVTGKMVNGPFFFTDMVGASDVWTVPAGTQCQPFNQPGAILVPHAVTDSFYVHLRFFVPAGQTLCTDIESAPVTFSGFRPY